MTVKQWLAGAAAIIILWVIVALLIFDTERSGFYAFVGILGIVASAVAFMFGAAIVEDM